jgi:hypothetical protein
VQSICHQAIFLAPLPGIKEEEEAPMSTTRQQNISNFSRAVAREK